jgi:hypothetical protein
LGTLGHKTGWDEYWEARHALDQVLARQPQHVRARVARGWIDYIVETKMRRGTRWLLGGGSKKRGLLAVREAAGAETDFFARTEARFALWEMQVRERDAPGAFATAGILVGDFPENQELRSFIEGSPIGTIEHCLVAGLVAFQVGSDKTATSHCAPAQAVASW